MGSAPRLKALLLSVVQSLLAAYEVRLEKEKASVDFFQQLRILNPRNLCDLPHSLSAYPLLRLQSVQGVEDEWNAYVNTTHRDIENPKQLKQFWDSRPVSPFREAALFLVTIITGSGSVERFFSFAQNTDTDRRHALSNNTRRAAFMSHYNGDLEAHLQ